MISFWFYATFAKHQRKLFPQFKVKELEVFPVPKNIDKQYEVQIETLVDQILIEKSQNPLYDTLELEKKIEFLQSEPLEKNVQEYKISSPIKKVNLNTKTNSISSQISSLKKSKSQIKL
jgi:hypothetical protein